MSDTVNACLHFTLLFCAIAAYTLNREKDSPFIRLAVLYLAVTAVFDGIAAAIWLTDFLSEVVDNNLFVYHILTPIQYTIVVFMFLKVIKKDTVKRWMIHSIPIFWIVAILLTLFVQPLDDYSTYSLLIKYILIVSIVLYFLLEILNTPDDYVMPIEQTAFWIATGFLLHSGGSVFAQGIANRLMKYSDPLYSLFNTFHSILNYILFASFIVAFMTKSKSSESEWYSGSN